MPKKNKKGRAGRGDSAPGRFRHYLSIFFVVLSVAVLASLYSYNAGDRSWFFNPEGNAPQNWFGPVGATISEALLQFSGMSSFLLGLLLLTLAVITARERRFESRTVRLAGLVLITVAFTALLELIFTHPLTMGGTAIMPGGWIGHLLAGFLGGLVNTVGSWVVLLAALLIGVMMISSFTPGILAGGAVSAISGWCARCGEWSSGMLEAWRERRERRRAEKTQRKKGKPDRKIRHEAAGDDGRAKSPKKKAPQINHGARRAVAEPDLPHAAFGLPMPPADPPLLEQAPRPPAEKKVAADMTPPRQNSKKKKELEGEFKTPPLDLLNMPLPDAGVDEDELVRKSKLLVEKLQEFGVGGNVVRIHPGPVVTTFEFRPDPGVKYSRVVSLSDDLCLALRADSIRIDRMAGHSTVGLEVPNINREIIAIREILDSESFRDTPSRLPLALGKTIDGKIYTADLAAMPHLLIAGATGMGKSVGLNIMISSILYRSTPAEVRFVLIDPKRLELGIYEDIPHLLTPVVTDHKLAASALKWAVTEMENRYTTLASYGVRNIEQYNSVVRKEAESGPRKPAAATAEAGADGAVEKLTVVETKENRPLPYIVVVIDELADLMMMGNSSEVELCIARLAHMARAVGIHLVVATQRPSVDVITGLIKANLPARISFRVSSRIDSRTIIDTGGAEKLLGNGDMLFLPPGSSRLVRIHGAYITEQESNLLVDYLRAQARPNYELDLEAAEDLLGAGMGAGGDNGQDPLYDEAVRIVVKGGQASISHLQRRLKIGYSRAARLIDYMELDGIVGPHEGSKAREILVDADYFDGVDEQER
jgi:S-DNA-T family DNA segregation ATPase FtsK/SpoIIIE